MSLPAFALALLLQTFQIVTYTAGLKQLSLLMCAPRNLWPYNSWLRRNSSTGLSANVVISERQLHYLTKRHNAGMLQAALVQDLPPDMAGKMLHLQMAACCCHHLPSDAYLLIHNREGIAMLRTASSIDA